MNIRVLVIITLLFSNTISLHGMDKLKGFFGFNRPNKNASSKEVSLQKDASVPAKKNGINGHNDIKNSTTKITSNLTELPRNLQLQIRNNLVTNDLYSTLQNVLSFSQVSQECRRLIFNDEFIELLAEKFKENPVSIAVALGKFDKTAYERERKRLVSVSQQYDSVKNAEVQRYEEEKDMSGLLALQKYIYFAEQDRLTLSKLPDEVQSAVVDHLVTDNLYTAIQNLLPLTQVSRHFRALVFDKVFIDQLSKKFNSDPVSVAVALGNFSTQEQQAERKRIIDLANADEATKNRELEKCRRENNIGELVALRKYGVNLYGYDEKEKKPRDYAGFKKIVNSESPCSKEFFELLMHCYKPNINFSEHRTNSILFKAVENNYSKDFIKMLLQHGANVHDHEEDLISQAVLRGRYEIIQLFLDYGAKIHPYNSFRTPILERVISGYKQHMQQTQDFLAYEQALANGRSESDLSLQKMFLESLLDRKVALTKETVGKKENLPFGTLEEIKKRYHKTLKCVLQLGDIDVDQSSEKTKKTALMYAAEEGQIKMVKMLLNSGADTSLRDKNDKTALELAEAKGHAAVIKRLKDTQEHHLKT